MRERVLIGKISDKHYTNAIIEVCKRLTAIQPEIKDFTPLDNETLKDVLNNGINVREKLKDDLRKEASKMTVPVLKKEIEIKAETIISDFENLIIKIKEILNLNPEFIPIELYSLSGGSVVCDLAKAKPLIDEATNIYLSDEQDLKLYELLSDIQPKIKEIYRLLSPYWNLRLFEIEGGISLFDHNMNLKVNIVAALKHRREAEQQLKQRTKK